MAIASIFLLASISSIKAQNYRVLEDTARLLEQKLKSVSMHYVSIDGQSRFDGAEMLALDFNKEGKLVRERQFVPFDIIPYSNETLYYYEENRLVKKLEIDQHHANNKKDSVTARVLGGLVPDTHKILYSYHSKRPVVVENEYSDPKSDEPNLITSRSYNGKGSLVKEEVRQSRAIKKKLKKSGAQVFVEKDVKYQYNALGLLIEKQVSNTAAYNQYKTTYTYNSEGQLLKRHSENPKGAGTETTYTYSQGRLVASTSKRLGRDGTNTTTYTYNEDGLLVREDEQHSSGSTSANVYSYNEQGLLVSETWINSKGEETFSFRYTYEFFN